ncbi:carbonic anhydrase [Cyanobium sp. Morenito 9A2]|uniref:carbonic anhydrase n=1 Tax=Cyanobium sp. Morenito 9A2 TaxID=2823718 RepID=UPI0020CC69AD|nr:carbonic anhydrase [Cyanobium sp. Morenito 9A2]MCP9850683.1 carbonic anhydrase [Cyanobium sp. Morenito 9A2]
MADTVRADAPEEALSTCRPVDPLRALLEGNARFAAAWIQADRASAPASRSRALSRLWRHNCITTASTLVGGQAPWAVVLACADSRVAPEWIFDAAPSDLFVIRSAGNTAFDDAVASLEYAIDHLAVPLVLVVGHSGCGAVTAALGSAPLTPLLSELVAPIRASLQPGDDLQQAVVHNAKRSAAELSAKSDLVQRALTEGRLTIRSSVYDIASGKVTLLNV